MKKSENKTARRIVLDLDAEQFTKYQTLARIVRKHRGPVSLSDIFAPLMPDAEYVAGCIVSEWCENERERVPLCADLLAAGVDYVPYAHN